MLLRFREVKAQSEPVEQKGQVKLDNVVQEHPDLVRLDSVEVKITAWKDAELYHLHGRQSANAVLRCSRCLTDVEETLSSDWHEVFTDDASRLEQDSDEEIHLIDVNQPTDLTPYIREALVLSIPFAPLCREDCKGLCPTCGTNWNEATCHCDNRKVDPRLAKLGELLKRDD
ncbi:MAG: DUF177 domain-containing protein [Firmicutes bacterium]|mgnify:CR=1 FL=1|uniref:DUF177 domain-containing protein n=1 Tax=Melghirimyces thermohalophilus TaxID=1236220 RepID=A0A1G6NK33_9BACL|nr:DUF177 domain-containing protein [Melghirimyces thermohalophilus]MDA8352677.1 DUF177 domain-containing protein [Bacillota bacterium]SDC67505.1 uncharacterized protein SAMN04488112_11326 [Melghirimyces thermohalophilus]